MRISNMIYIYISLIIYPNIVYILFIIYIIWINYYQLLYFILSLCVRTLFVTDPFVLDMS